LLVEGSNSDQALGVYKGFARKGLKPRSATFGLLMKNIKCTKKRILLNFVLARKSRQIVETCERKQRHIMWITLWKSVGENRDASPTERPCVDECIGKGHAAHLVSH